MPNSFAHAHTASEAFSNWACHVVFRAVRTTDQNQMHRIIAASCSKDKSKGCFVCIGVLCGCWGVGMDGTVAVRGASRLRPLPDTEQTWCLVAYRDHDRRRRSRSRSRRRDRDGGLPRRETFLVKCGVRELNPFIDRLIEVEGFVRVKPRLVDALARLRPDGELEVRRLFVQGPQSAE